MAASYPALTLTDLTAWSNAMTANAGMANKKIFVQNRSTNDLLVYFGGGSAPGANDGTLVKPREALEGTAATIWLKGKGIVSFLELDS